MEIQVKEPPKFTLISRFFTLASGIQEWFKETICFLSIIPLALFATAMSGIWCKKNFKPFLQRQREFCLNEIKGVEPGYDNKVTFPSTV